MRAALLAAVLFALAANLNAADAKPAPHRSLCEITSIWLEVGELKIWRGRLLSPVGDRWSEARDRAGADAVVKLVMHQPRGSWAFDAWIRENGQRKAEVIRGPVRLSAAAAIDALAETLAERMVDCPERTLEEKEAEGLPLVSGLSPEEEALAAGAARHYDAGDFTRAVETLERYLRLVPRDPYAHANLGLALMAQEQWSAAAKALERSVKLNPQNDVAYFNLGFCYWKAGRSVEARETLERALVLNPEYEKARLLLASLDRETSEE